MNFNLFANMVSMLGAGLTNVDLSNQTWWTNIVKPIINGIGYILLPLIIIAASLGTIYAVKLGIDLARAESADKRDEAKQKMIYFIVAFAITIILLVLLQLFISNAEAVFSWITTIGQTKAE